MRQDTFPVMAGPEHINALRTIERARNGQHVFATELVLAEEALGELRDRMIAARDACLEDNERHSRKAPSLAVVR